MLVFCLVYDGLQYHGANIYPDIYLSIACYYYHVRNWLLPWSPATHLSALDYGREMAVSSTVKQSDKAIAGVVAGATTVALLHPLDVIKTRLQVQDGVLPIYRGMLDAVTKIWHSSGVRGLYAGRMGTNTNHISIHFNFFVFMSYRLVMLLFHRFRSCPLDAWLWSCLGDIFLCIRCSSAQKIPKRSYKPSG